MNKNYLLQVKIYLQTKHDRLLESNLFKANHNMKELLLTIK